MMSDVVTAGGIGSYEEAVVKPKILHMFLIRPARVSPGFYCLLCQDLLALISPVPRKTADYLALFKLDDSAVGEDGQKITGCVLFDCESCRYVCFTLVAAA